MKKITLVICAIVLALAKSSFALALFSDDFNSYSNGNLVGQGGWTLTAAAAGTQPQVSGGAVVLGTSGPDVYNAFSGGAYTLLTGDVITSTLVLTINTAQANGDYFFHLSNPAGTTSNFYNRLYAKSTTGGFLLGISGNGLASSIVYGATVLTLGQSYTVDTMWTIVSGIANDTFAISVNGSSYLTGVTYGATSTAEPAALAAVNLRQGTASSAPGVLIDSIAVSVTSVPEPHEYGIALGSLLGVVILVHRRKVAMMA